MGDSDEIKFFNKDNFIIVGRALFDPDRLRAVRRKIETEWNQLAVRDERGAEGLKVGVAPDTLRLREEWYSIWETTNLSLLTRHIPQFDQVIYPPQIRTVRDRPSFVGWHQDIAYMRALGARGHSEVMTCYVPLDEDTSGRPSLQFYINPEQSAIAHDDRADAMFNSLRLYKRDEPAESCKTYELRLGDAFLFGKLVVHRTHAMTDSFSPRTSMEFRLTTRPGSIKGKDYFDLTTMRFRKEI